MNNLILIILIILNSFCLISSQKYDCENLIQERNGVACDLVLKDGNGPFGDDIKLLYFRVFFETKQRIRIQIKDKLKNRWEGKIIILIFFIKIIIIIKYLVPYIVKSSTPNNSPNDLDYLFRVNQKPFSFQILRKSNNEILFDTSSLPFVVNIYIY
jgi:hypothetical protein